MSEIIRSAEISPCGKFRYALVRQWNHAPVPNMFGISALNPSKADADIDDPTVCKLMVLGKFWGFDGYVLGNLWPLRATDPVDLFTCQDDVNGNRAIGRFIEQLRKHHVKEVVCCWGTHSKKPWRSRIWDRGAEMRQHLHTLGFTLSYLGANRDGTPKHPLYLSPTTLRHPYGPWGKEPTPCA